MGTVSLKIGDGTARFRRSTLCSSALNLIMLASVLTTNLFALYAFTSPSHHHHHHSSLSPALFHHHQHRHNKTLSAVVDHVSLILREIASSEQKLHQIHRDLAGYQSLDPTSPSLSSEAKLFLSRHPLPLGRDARSGISHFVSSISHSCSPDSISKYTSYTPYSPCPSGGLDIQTRLLSKGCEPLPRRRCLTRSPKPSPLLLPFPLSLWPPSAKGLSRQMWVSARGKNDFLIDDVLALGSGSVHVSFDVSGGVGDFAARMAERNVTVATSGSGVEVDVVAERGLIPLLLTPAARFPFQDSVFDLVHVGRGLDEGGVQGEGRGMDEALEFLMFDIDRVMRAGGLLWLDNYVCVDDERKRTVTRLVETFKYKKLKWVVGEKATGGGKTQVYLSAVLQKPARG